MSVQLQDVWRASRDALIWGQRQADQVPCLTDFSYGSSYDSVYLASRSVQEHPVASPHRDWFLGGVDQQ